MVIAASLKICWDSNCFIAYLAEEPERVEVCGDILRAAERGEVELYASYMAFVETVRVPGMDERKSDASIIKLFDLDYVTNVILGLTVAREARRLQQIANLGARDAVHLATALAVEADVLQTYDTDLRRLDCEALGLPIRIEEPDETGFLLSQKRRIVHIPPRHTT